MMKKPIKLTYGKTVYLGPWVEFCCTRYEPAPPKPEPKPKLEEEGNNEKKP